MVNTIANSSRSRAPLDSVIATSELSRRERRPADYESESRALAGLMREMASASGNVLQRLAETVMNLCRAHSAGVSVLHQTDQGPVFQWRAVAGQWSRFLGGTMPRDASPCGTVLDRDCAVLLAHPERYFALPPELTPPVSEVLLVPFHVDGKPVGTIWVIAHDETCRFDEEDQRLITSLGDFASSACQMLDTQGELREIAVANQKLYEKAQAANRAKDDFFASLSHELRTPMTSVLGWSALLERNPNRETAIDAARAITSSASLQAQLVDDLLDVSRMMTGKFSISKSDVDLRAIVQDALTSVRPSAAGKGVALRSEASASIMISGDTTRLRQVIGNLLSNAIKFTPNGGVVVTRLALEGTTATVTVSDTGEGIPAQFLPHVFERYTQLGERRYGGLGLGLAIVKHIVDLHDGSVFAESAGEGRGATFTVRLPA